MSIRELFTDYLKPNDSQGPALPGEFFWVPTPEIDFKVVEVQRATPTAHTEAQFRLADYHDQRHYREKAHLPVKLISLDASSEALLHRSKKRPCLVLGSAFVADHGTLTLPQDRTQARQLERMTFLLAPLYSANSAADPRGPFPPELLLRIEQLRYPHLAWVPPLDGQGPGSVLRLDRVFAMSADLLTVSARCKKKASKEAFDIVRAQLAEVFGIPRDDVLDEHFRETKELVNLT